MEKTMPGKKFFSCVLAVLTSFTGTAAAAVSEADILLHASFENIINADKANGSQIAKSGKETDFSRDGIRGKCLRLHEGNFIEFERKNNADVMRGSVVFWIRPVDWDPGKQSKNYHWLFSMEKNSPDGGGIRFFRMPSPLFMFMIGKNGKAKQITTGPGNWKRGEWRFAAMTWGNGKTALYINGKRIVSVALPPDQAPSDVGTAIRLASSSGTTDYDEFTIYRRPLTQGEIEAIFLSGAPERKDSLKYVPQAEAGISSEKETDDSSVLTIEGFLSIPELENVPGTEVKMSGAPNALRFRLKTSLEPGNYPKPESAGFKSIWENPSAEILVRTGLDATLPTWQIGFNMFGQKLTFKDSKEFAWKADVRTEIKNGEWTADVTIPYESFGVPAPKPGDVWLFNFGRNFQNPRFFSNPALCLAYGEHAKWWRIAFRRKPGASVSIEVDKKRNKLKWKLRNGEEGDSLSVLLKKLPVDLKNLNRKLETPEIAEGIVIEDRTEKKAADSELSLPGEGRYLALFRIYAKDGSVRYRQLFHFIQKESFVLEPVFLSRDKIMNLNCELNMPLKNRVLLSAEIIDAAGRTVAKKQQEAAPGASRAVFPFSMKDWKELDYTARVRLIENGKVLEERSRPFKCCYNASWIGFEKTIGYENKIPAPWIPLKADGRRIRTLTQLYELDRDGLPAQVTAAGKKLLAAKIKLDMAGFRQISELSFLKKTPGEVVWQTEFASAEAKAVLKGTMEFDGMIRYDLTVTPEKETLLKKLLLTIPASKENGKYFIPYPGPYQTWTVLDMETDASKPYSDAFMPHLWTGGNEAGIAWFAESDEFYVPADERKVVSILPNAKSTDMVIDMIGRDCNLKETRTYTFGIQATPAKPMPDKWFNWNFASCTGTSRKPLVTAGYTTGMEYHTYSGLPYPTKDDARAKRYVEETRRTNPRNFPLIYTTSNGIGGKCPEFQFFEQEWKNQKSCDTWTLAARGEYHWGTNPASQTFRDFYLWSAKQAIDKFEPDGFYYDFGTVSDVDDPAGKCTYMRNGKRRTTWPIFSDRAMRRALYQMVLDKRGHAVFIYHNYSKPFVPVTSFASMILDGEPYQQRTGVIGVKVTTDYTELIPLSRFRSMFGIQFGYIPYFLAKLPDGTSGSPETVKATRTLLAMALPHGVAIWGFYCDINELNKVLRIQDDFKIGEAEFFPCISENAELKTSPEKKDQILTACWKKKNGEYLVVAGNITGEPYSGELMIPGGKTMKIEIPAKDFNLYRIYADGTGKKY